MFTGKSSINVGTVCSHVISIAVLSRLPEGQGAFEGVSLSPQMRKEWPASPVSSAEGGDILPLLVSFS